MAGDCIILLILERCKLEIKETCIYRVQFEQFAYWSEPANICKSLLTPPQKIKSDQYQKIHIETKCMGVITPP